MKTKQLEKLLTDLLLNDQEKFYRIAYSYVKNQEDALDVIQDSIHKALKTIHSLENVEGLRNWFIRIVINTSLDLLRKKKREVLVDDNTIEFVSPNSTDHYENVDLTRLLEMLSPTYRIIIILRFFEDLTFHEIAEILHENENTIKTRFYKALKLLRAHEDYNSYLGG